MMIQIPMFPGSGQTYPTPTLRHLPVRERPASRVADYGAHACSLAELLAAIVGGPHQIEIAYALLERFGDAELASMVAPRALIVEEAQAPELELSGKGGGAPARLVTRYTRERVSSPNLALLPVVAAFQSVCDTGRRLRPEIVMG